MRISTRADLPILRCSWEQFKMNSKRQHNKRELGPPNKRPREITSFDRRKPLQFGSTDQSARPNTIPPGRPSAYSNSEMPIVSDRPASFSRHDPSQANAKDRSKAKRILKRNAIAPITEDQASSREDFLKIQEDIKWARAVLPNFERDSIGPKEDAIDISRESLIVKVQVPPSKEIRYADAPLGNRETFDPVDYARSSFQPAKRDNLMLEEQGDTPKRSKSHETFMRRSFAEVARGRTIIGVIDNGNIKGKVSRSQWGWIQAALASVALEVLRENPGPPPSCTDAGWFQGNTKLIACDDDRSAMLYGVAIAKIGEIYPGAQLEVVGIKDIPSRPWATAWLPETPSESRDILEMVSALNPELPTGDWKVIKADGFNRAMMQVIFQINHESIEHLIRCDGLLNYGFNKVRMKFYRNPYEALSNLEAFAAAVDPPSDDEPEANEIQLDEDSF